LAASLRKLESRARRARHCHAVRPVCQPGRHLDYTGKTNALSCEDSPPEKQLQRRRPDGHRYKVKTARSDSAKLELVIL
jgi:hypothetical protein